MPLSRPLRSRRARHTLASSALVTAGVWLLASACGPGVATPMPEPPTVFDLSGFMKDPTVATKTPLDNRVLVIQTSTGNVPLGATVRRDQSGQHRRGRGRPRHTRGWFRGRPESSPTGKSCASSGSTVTSTRRPPTPSFRAPIRRGNFFSSPRLRASSA